MLSYFLNFLYLISLGGLFLVIVTPYKYIEFIRFSSLCITLFLFWIILIIWSFFETNLGIIQFTLFYNQVPICGVDGLSLIFLLLTTFLFFCIFLLVWNINYHSKLLICLLLFLECLLIFVFSVLDIFLFYILFELILLPMLLIIFIWGSRSRKIKASFYFFLYTLFGSLFMLVGILLLYYEFGTTNLLLLSYLEVTYIKQLLFWILFFFSFAIKIPMFPFHIWLPEAHVEAPTIGSVILAGLLLKLGAYGFLRIVLPLFPQATIFFQPFVLTLASLGVLYASFILLCQMDLKKIIAYSSVAHMNFAVLGLFSNTILGIQGSLFLFISHGFSSSALFILVGILYERYHTRLLPYYGGLVQLMPLYAIFFFFFTIANFGFPGTSNFIGEFLIFLGLGQKSFFLICCAGVGMLFSVIYSILLFSRLLFGELKFYYLIFSFYSDLTRQEFFILLFLTIVLFFFGFFPIPLFNLMIFPCYLLLF